MVDINFVDQYIHEQIKFTYYVITEENSFPIITLQLSLYPIPKTVYERRGPDLESK